MIYVQLIGMFLLIALVIMFYFRATVWVLTKASDLSRLIVFVACAMFGFAMAKFNSDVSRGYMIAYIIAAVFNIVFAIVTFNKMFPTVKKEDR